MENEDTQTTNTTINTAEDFSRQIKELTAQLEAVKKNKDTILDEKRRETEAKQQALEELKKYDKELSRARGDTEQLLKSSEAERAALAERLEKLTHDIAAKETKIIAKDLVQKLKPLTPGAGTILEDFIARRLKYSEDGVKVTNDKGELTVSTTDDLLKEFRESETWKPFIEGSAASGGRPVSAPGRASPKQPDPTQKISPIEKIHMSRLTK